ncbi:MAG: LysR family transcriptional regulator [Eggerthellaceae bacterium]|jgi:DNA-binding transcriptional LysR family regulator
MDAEKCTTLLKVIELGSLSAAAAEIAYTPSGISRMVASLEHEVGFPLLIRGKGGVAPTAECRQLMPAFTELAAAQRTCETLAASIRGLEQGVLTVGSAYPQFYRPLAGIIADFTAAHPGIHIDIVQANSSALLERMEQHSMDFAIMSKRGKDHRWQPLIHDRMVAVLPSDHPLANKDSYPIERFTSEPFIDIYPGEESDNSRTLDANGVKPHARYTVHDTKAAFALVEAGLGITMMNDIYARESTASIATVPVSPFSAIEIGVATPRSTPSPALDAFRVFALPRLTSQAASR